MKEPLTKFEKKVALSESYLQALYARRAQLQAELKRHENCKTCLDAAQRSE